MMGIASWGAMWPRTNLMSAGTGPHIAGTLAVSAAGLGSEAWKWQRLTQSAVTTQADHPAAGRASADSLSVRTPAMARVEAALFVAQRPMSLRRLCQFAMLSDAAQGRETLTALEAAYAATGSPFQIQRLATGYQLMTLPRYAFWLNRLHQRQAEQKLSPAAIETLSIVAYRQPVTRADIDAIRGVQSAEMIKQLMERGLVRIGGQDDSLGRPFLYETTSQFLELFGLPGLEQLPMAETLRRLPAQPAAAPEDPFDSGATPPGTDDGKLRDADHRAA